MLPALTPLLKRALIFAHRWLGVALCVVFLLWFPSGIGMMYWDYPGVSDGDRLEHSPTLEAAQIHFSPQEAYSHVAEGPPPTPIRLNSFDNRPIYRFGNDDAMVYADTGEAQVEVSPELMLRVAAAWTGQPADAARIEAVEEVDQWTVGGVFRNAPLRKYSWPDGQQVYIAEGSGEVVQYTTTGSRLGAYVGAIPHWFYFTPLRRHGQNWSRVVIWSSGIGTIAALLGVVIGLWMYSPSRQYRIAGAPTSIPYRGQKRWHTVFGLIFGLGAVTWAFSGMLSMDPFPSSGNSGGPRRSPAASAIPQALRGSVEFPAYAAKPLRQALLQIASLPVKQLEFASFAGEPIYLATLAGGATHVVPVGGAPRESFDPQQIIDIVTKAAGRGGLADIRVLDQYDAYYLDRRRERPLPVVRAQLNDANETLLYINPKTGRIVGTYSSRNWVNRWAYHGLHSLDFPWLYNYRPLWDIVVITFMLGGTALCVTSLILAWQVLGRSLRNSLRTTDALRSASLADSSR